MAGTTGAFSGDFASEYEVSMERGRILIVGKTKENTYEVRNLLDKRRFEIEIALSPDVAKMIFCQRYMNLVVVHTEMPAGELRDVFVFFDERGLELPVFIVGEEPEKLREAVPSWLSVACFAKPYDESEILKTIDTLEVKSAGPSVGFNPYIG